MLGSAGASASKWLGSARQTDGGSALMTERPDENLTLSVDEAARLLGISPGLAYGLVHRGELAAIRLGRRILVPRHAVEALVGQPDDNVA
jgi:excisionase family DNA binding protein